MSFYLVENSSGIVEIVESPFDYFVFEAKNPSVQGCFGRKEYAEIWRDFRNGKMDSTELGKRLN